MGMSTGVRRGRDACSVCVNRSSQIISSSRMRAKLLLPNTVPRG